MDVTHLSFLFFKTSRQVRGWVMLQLVMILFLKASMISSNKALSMGIKWHEICQPARAHSSFDLYSLFRGINDNSQKQIWTEILLSSSCKHENSAVYICNKIAWLWNIIVCTDEKMINLNKRKGTNSLVVIDDGTIDWSRRMISIVYRSILTTQI